MSTLKTLEFSGASGMVKFSGPDRTGIVNIMQRVGTGYIQVGRYLLDFSNSTDQLYLNESLLRWMTPNGWLPSDGRPGKADKALEQVPLELANVRIFSSSFLIFFSTQWLIIFRLIFFVNFFLLVH